jgi:hypothetical protein
MFIKEEQVSYEKTYTNTRWLLALDSPMFNKNSGDTKVTIIKVHIPLL